MMLKRGDVRTLVQKRYCTDAPRRRCNLPCTEFVLTRKPYRYGFGILSVETEVSRRILGGLCTYCEITNCAVLTSLIEVAVHRGIPIGKGSCTFTFTISPGALHVLPAAQAVHVGSGVPVGVG